MYPHCTGSCLRGQRHKHSSRQPAQLVAYRLNGMPQRQPFLSSQKCVILGEQNSGSQRSGAPAMDYEELVAKVIELLQREKRVPYRVLKRRFELDDDYIEDVKIDLIEAKQIAADENDRILIWIGDAQAVTSQVAQATQPPAAQQQPSLQGTPRVTAPPSP